MDKVKAQQNSICFILTALNLLYVLFILSETDIFAGTFDMRGQYIPGAIFGFFIFPSANFFLWKTREQIKPVDYSLVIMPIILWLFVIPGGSFTNFLFINPPVIGTISTVYLVRFCMRAEGKKIYFISSYLWVFIIIILLCINYFVPILPE